MSERKNFQEIFKDNKKQGNFKFSDILKRSKQGDKLAQVLLDFWKNDLKVAHAFKQNLNK